MSKTYEPIATTTVGSGVGTVTFSSIPQTYTDLIIVSQNTAVSGNRGISIRVGNGSVDTGTNYSATFLYGTGSAAVSTRDTNQNQAVIAFTDSSTTALNSNFVAHIMNYSNTTTNKTILSRNSATDRVSSMCVALWRSTNAINIISLLLDGVNYLSGSTFTLYGIKAE